MTMKFACIITSLLTLNINAQAADPLSALTAIERAVHATSIVDIITKAAAHGAEINSLKNVPRLKVVSDCGDCRLSNATRMLMISAYDDLAKANDVTVNQDQPVIFKITSITSRNSVLRGTFGVLSGADVIRGHFEGDTNTIGEYSISHEMGIDEITQSLGDDLLKIMVSKNAGIISEPLK